MRGRQAGAIKGITQYDFDKLSKTEGLLEKENVILRLRILPMVKVFGDCGCN